MEKECCLICKFYNEKGRGTGWGHCRKSPPPFPQVDREDWCGSFENRLSSVTKQNVQENKIPNCTCNAGTGGHASWCELEIYWKTLR